jgi:riboflavin kinase/FMN adenylyltransferase
VKTVLTLGTFDGVHRGHQRLLAVARRRAQAVGGEVLAIAFERPPRLHFAPEPGPVLLTTPFEKESLLRAHGADRVESVPFSDAVARLTADRFLAQFVGKKWKADEIVVGFNFRFGRGREGDDAFLKALGPVERKTSPSGFRGDPRRAGGVVWRDSIVGGPRGYR